MDGGQKLQVTYSDGGNRTGWLFPRARGQIRLCRPDLRPSSRSRAGGMPERQAYVEHKVGKIDNPGMFLKPTMQFTRKGRTQWQD